jgi:hypothetical protein
VYNKSVETQLIFVYWSCIPKILLKSFFGSVGLSVD